MDLGKVAPKGSDEMIMEDPCQAFTPESAHSLALALRHIKTQNIRKRAFELTGS